MEKSSQELPAEVLVQGILVAFVVVQVVKHAGVGAQPVKQVSEVAHAVLPEHGHHVSQLLADVDLAIPGAEDHVPEEGHFFLKLAGTVNHSMDPLMRGEGGALVPEGMQPEHQVFLYFRLTPRV